LAEEDTLLGVYAKKTQDLLTESKDIVNQGKKENYIK
jgi:hypothetical protein